LDHFFSYFVTLSSHETRNINKLTIYNTEILFQLKFIPIFDINITFRSVRTELGLERKTFQL